MRCALFRDDSVEVCILQTIEGQPKMDYMFVMFLHRGSCWGRWCLSVLTEMFYVKRCLCLLSLLLYDNEGRFIDYTSPVLSFCVFEYIFVEKSFHLCQIWLECMKIYFERRHWFRHFVTKQDCNIFAGNQLQWCMLLVLQIRVGVSKSIIKISVDRTFYIALPVYVLHLLWNNR